jgi:predicted DCC family thiol-disulfide oxidoreductase YuxK
MRATAPLPNTNYPLTLLYDGACPVCALEMDHLRERSQDGRLVFVDLSAPGFDAVPEGFDLAQLNAEIHAVRPDGSVLKGVEVLRLAYEAAGLGWVLRPTAWPVLRPLFDRGYVVFARHRQRISRTLAPLISGVRALRARRALARMRACHDGRCDIGAGTRGDQS